MMTKLLSVNDYNNLPIVAGDVRLAYGTDENQFIDLFLPKERKRKHPTVLLIHGGCWQAQFGLAQMGQFARAVANNGLAVANIEYRRIGNGGGWPHTFIDVAKTADFLQTIANQYDLDLDNVVAVGHSAGGHLALWAAAREQIAPDSPLYMANPLPIKAVVSLAGIADLASGAEQQVCGNAIGQLMGGEETAVSSRYQAGSPSSYLPLGKPHWHIVGEKDSIVPVGYVKPFVEGAIAVGDEAKLIVEPNAGHFELVSATAAAWRTVEAAVMTLVG